MGKKRRLIKATSKFGNKHSSHPMFKKLSLEKQESTFETVKQKIQIEDQEKKIEIKKAEEKPTITQPITETKSLPVVKSEVKPTLNTKTIKAKKDTPKSSRKKSGAKRIKKTKQVKD